MRLFMLRSRSRAVFAIVILAMSLAGCQQLFTTSLGSSLARANIVIAGNLSPSDAADLAAQAKANEDTKLATALIATLIPEIAATTDPVVKQELEASAASAAIVASGAGTDLTGLIDTLSSGSGSGVDSATLTALMASIKAGATPDVIAALSYLDPATGIIDPAASGLSATDYAIAAIIVASSALPADPSSMTPAEVATFQASPAGQSALRILSQADSLVTPGSASADLLDSLKKQFQL